MLAGRGPTKTAALTMCWSTAVSEISMETVPLLGWCRRVIPSSDGSAPAPASSSSRPRFEPAGSCGCGGKADLRASSTRCLTAATMSPSMGAMPVAPVLPTSASRCAELLRPTTILHGERSASCAQLVPRVPFTSARAGFVGPPRVVR